MTSDQLSDRLADSGAAAPWIAALASWLAPINSVLQVLLTLAGIMSAIAAAYYYFKKARR